MKSGEIISSGSKLTNSGVVEDSWLWCFVLSCVSPLFYHPYSDSLANWVHNFCLVVDFHQLPGDFNLVCYSSCLNAKVGRD